MTSSGKKDYSESAYLNAFNAAQGGQDLNTVLFNSQGYENVAKMGFEAAGGGQPEYNPFEEMMAQQTAAAAQEKEEREAAIEENRITQGQNDRDSAYSSYLDAAGTATDFVNTQVEKEAANAKILGVDYNIDDDIKASRINDYFATIWGEGQQTDLDALMTEFGNPEGFEDFIVTRGTGASAEVTEGSETSVGGTTKPIKGPDTPDAEEDILGTSSILGA